MPPPLLTRIQVSFSQSSSFVMSLTFITALLVRFPNEVTHGDWGCDYAFGGGGEPDHP